MDQYIAQPELLRGRPKQTPGEVARAQGLKVPRIYGSIEEALAEGGEFLLRSENWREYGVSGILDSYEYTSMWTGKSTPVSRAEQCKQVLENYQLDGIEKNIANILAHPDYQWDLIASKIGIYPQEEIMSDLVTVTMAQNDAILFCKISGIDPVQFAKETSFSMWEYIEGTNVSIVADSAVEGRYHAIVKHYGHMMIENGNITAPLRKPNKHLQGVLLDMPSWYERVRRLPGVDPVNCPIVEAQIDSSNEPWFLQYHRTRDFAPATHKLTRPPTTDEVVAVMVRGSTDAEGFTARQEPSGDVDELIISECLLNANVRVPVAELQAPQARLQLIDGNAKQISSMMTGHCEISRMFKPEVTVGIGDGWDKLIEKGEPDEPKYFHVVSDGTTAYVRRERS